MNPASKTFCPLPWVHLFLQPDGNIMPCCTSKVGLGNINQTDMKTAWNSEPLKKIRTELLSGLESPNCKHCFDQEKLGKFSHRQESVDIFETEIAPLLEQTAADGFLNTFNLQSIDFRFSNLCNFKCRPCNAGYSSAIAAEENHTSVYEKTVFLKPGLTKKQVYTDLQKHYPTIRRIYFAGGEPLLQWEHWSVLKDLTDGGFAKNIELTYSTNGSQLKQNDKDIFSLWKQFKGVGVCLSVDAIGKQAEYWRHGTKWDEIEKVIESLRDFKNVHGAGFEYSLNSTLAWPTVTTWIRLIKHCLEKGLITSPRQFSAFTVDDPVELSLSSLPQFKKEKIEAELNEFKHYLNTFFGDNTGDTKVDYVINFLRSHDTQISLPNFKRHLLLDKLRNEDFFETFPEHLDLKPYFST